MILKRPDRGRLAIVQTGEQRLGLTTKVIETGTGRKGVGHGTSMHDLGPHAGCTKERARVSSEPMKGELNSSRGPGGCLPAIGMIAD